MRRRHSFLSECFQIFRVISKPFLLDRLVHSMSLQILEVYKFWKCKKIRGFIVCNLHSFVCESCEN